MMQVLRPKELARILGVSVPTIYRYDKQGLLPPRRRIGPKISGWLKSEISTWLESRPTESCLDPERQEKMQAGRRHRQG